MRWVDRVCVAALALCASVVAPLACDPVPTGRLEPPGPRAVEYAFSSAPAGAALFVDGTPVGTAPATLKLNPGPHTVKATLSGYFSQEQRLLVTAGEATGRLELTLVASH